MCQTITVWLYFNANERKIDKWLTFHMNVCVFSTLWDFWVWTWYFWSHGLTVKQGEVSRENSRAINSRKSQPIVLIAHITQWHMFWSHCLRIKSRITWKWPCSCTNMHFYTIVVPIMQLFEFVSGRNKGSGSKWFINSSQGPGKSKIDLQRLTRSRNAWIRVSIKMSKDSGTRNYDLMHFEALVYH